MGKFIIASFSQARFLADETDPDVAGGVCVALCNLWLRSILDRPKVEPQHRMQFMATQIDQAKSDQKKYGQLREVIGREDARREVGRVHGVDYDDKTSVMHACVGKVGILAKVSADLTAPGSAAAWSMRFAQGGGHAIAGLNRLERVTSNITRMHVHVFDPNIGEYIGPFTSLNAIADDLFHKFPLYELTVMLHRAEAKQLG